jgi:protein-tyrosine phosphatase
MKQKNRFYRFNNNQSEKPDASVFDFEENKNADNKDAKAYENTTDFIDLSNAESEKDSAKHEDKTNKESALVSNTKLLKTKFDKAKHDKTKLTKTKTLKTKQYNTKQYNTKQDNTKQYNTKQVDIKQDNAKQNNIKQDNAKQDKPKTKKFTILFVCTGNTCRSPMAQQLLKEFLKKKRLLSKFSVLSAGIYADEGTAMNNFSAFALSELGIKPAEHKSTQLSENLIQKSDLIICMTEGHKNALDSTDKVYTIGEITGGAEVPDPYGKHKEQYLAVAKYLEYACVDIYQLCKKLYFSAI